MLLFVYVTTSAQKDTIEGEVSAYLNIHPKEEISCEGYASLYYKKNFYQVRYNYEDDKTFSFYYGRPVIYNKAFYFEFVPTIGVSVGNFTGVSPSFQVYSEVGKFEFFSSNQYSVCLTKPSNSFFFSWSEALFKYKNTLKVGASCQITSEYNSPQISTEERKPVQVDAALVTGVQYKRFYVCGYFYNFWKPTRYYTVGLTYNLR
jgi:hypothetical protein